MHVLTLMKSSSFFCMITEEQNFILKNTNMMQNGWVYQDLLLIKSVMAKVKFLFNIQHSETLFSEKKLGK